jgi:hypothetical protein
MTRRLALGPDAISGLHLACAVPGVPRLVQCGRSLACFVGRAILPAAAF